jgi:D-alanyl-lipoteichoic acid acyltransferase DltB (MBOAT superfamily)
MTESVIAEAASELLQNLRDWDFWETAVFDVCRRHGVIYFLLAMPLIWAVQFLAPRRWWIPTLTIVSSAFIVATLSRRRTPLSSSEYPWSHAHFWDWGLSWIYPVLLLLLLYGVYRLARHSARKSDLPDMAPRTPLRGAVVIIIVGYGLLYGVRSWIAHTDGAGYRETAFTIFPDFHQMGVAYLLMKSIHYVWDLCYGRIGKQGWWRFFCWMTFFPSFRVGPLERYNDFYNQIDRCHRRWRAADLAAGAWRIGQGVFKNLLAIFITLAFLERKIAIAGPVGDVEMVELKKALYLYPDLLTYGQLWAVTWLMTAALYLDFAGYCDVAIGLSRLMGYRMAENFNYPFLSTSMRDWWRRWHISMSMFFRDYCYIPLGGNRRRVHLNYLVTFTLVGLWHEFRPHYLIWGALQGGALSVLRIADWIWDRLRLEGGSLHKILRKWRVADGGIVGSLIGIVVTANFFAVTFLLFVHVNGLFVAWRMIARPFEWLF